MIPRLWLRLAVAGISFVLGQTVSPLWAQQPPGKDCYAYPPGGKRGSTVAVKLGGTDWTPDTRFFVHDPRIKLEVVSPPGPVLMHEPPYWFDIKSFSNDPHLPREVSARFTIPADYPPGPIRWSVANANGAAMGGVFVVGETPSVLEEEARSGPQVLTNFPVTVEGRLGRIEEVDQYSFVASQSGPVTLSTMARSLGNELNLALSVQEEGGRTVAEMVDTEGIDPSLTFRVEKGKKYTLFVRDLDHRGYRSFTYRLTLAPAPRLVSARPAGGKRGTTSRVELGGFGIATGSGNWESVFREISFPVLTQGDKDKQIGLDKGESFLYRVETPFGVTNPISLQMGDGPEQLEPENPKGQPVSLLIPGAMNGRISRKGEQDRFTFAGKKGEMWIFEVQSRQIGSRLDMTLELLGPDGKSLGKKDDVGSSADPHLPVTLGADGIYTLVVGDVSGRPPEPSSLYRLVARKQVEGFTLGASGVIAIPLGGKGELTVTAVREGGFKDPVQIYLKGLPTGISTPKEMVIAANADSVKIPLECAKDAAVEAGLIDIVGTAKIKGKEVSRSPQPAPVGDKPAILQKVLVAITMKPPFKVRAAEADGGRRIPRGATHLAEILIERTDGFKGEIVLDMAANQQRHRQGIRGDSLVVAADKTKVFYPVFTPEWLETTRTSRIGLVASAKVLDPKGNPRYVLAAMEGQITMSMEGALMKIGVPKSADPGQELIGVPGGKVEIPFRLFRVPQLSGPVVVELVPDPRSPDLVSADPITLDPKTTSGKLVIKTKADDRLLGVRNVSLRATAKRDGFPVISETTVEVEWVRKP
jgi:hypothetical protein